MTGRTGWGNMMDVFADKEKQHVSASCGRDYWPCATVVQTFGQNCKERDPQKRSGRETDECAKGFVLQVQRGADPSTDKGKHISRNDLPEGANHLRTRDRVVNFAAMLRLDRDVNQFVMSTQQRSIGLATLRFVRHHRDDRRVFSEADLPDVQIGHERIAITL